MSDRALVALIALGGLLGAVAGLSLGIEVTRPAMQPTNCRSSCVPVSDPGVGRYWICPDRR